MGRRVLAVLLSMVLFVTLFVKSDAILGYADILSGTDETVTETKEVSEDINVENEESEEEIPVIEKTEVSSDVSDDDPPSEPEPVITTKVSEVRTRGVKTLFLAKSASSHVMISLDGNPDDDPEVLSDPTDMIGSMEVRIFDPSNKEIPIDDSNRATLSLNDTISVKYIFNCPLTIHPIEGGFEPFDGINIRSGARYALPGIPKICSRPGGFDIDVTNGTDTLGVIHFDEDGNAVLTVTEVHDEPEFAEKAVAGLESKLNLNKEENGDVEEYSLTFGSSTYLFRVKEFMPQPPTVEKKSLGIDSDGNITWKVTVTNDKNPVLYEEGYTFTDTIGDGQNFVEYSLTTGGVPVSYTLSGNTISWNHTDNTASKAISFEYKTHVDFLKLTSNINETKEASSNVKNTIKVTAPGTDTYDPLSISTTATDTVKKNIKQWLEKSGTKVDSNGRSKWTVTVRNNGFSLKDVVLHDKIVTDGVEIEITNIQVEDASHNPVTFSKSFESSELQIAFAEDMAGDAVYTVTYDTEIKNYEAFLKANHAVPKNEAYITYKYDPAGDGKGLQSVKGPGISRNFEGPGVMAKAAIKKTAKGIDVVNHTMDWLVEINNNEQAITGVSVTDSIPANQVFKSLKWVKIAGAEVDSSKYTLDDSDPTKPVITFGDNIEGKKASFYIITELTDADSYVWAGNNKKNYKNSTTLRSTGNPDVIDSVYQEYKSEVLSKKSGDYNYDTHEIQYTITVDHNAMEMTGVVVTDKLDDRLEYVADSSSLAGTTYDAASNTVTFPVGTVFAKSDIVFKAKVKDGDTFTNNAKFTIPNSATMISAQYSGETKVTCNTTINNSVIRKKGVQNDEVIEYSVEINAARQDLYREGIEEVVIEDTLGASLVLDDSSIKLYKATVSETGVFTKGDLAEDAVIKPVDRSTPKTVMSFVIPKSGRSDAYILCYTARMLKPDAKDYANLAVLKGYGDNSVNKSNVTYDDSNFSHVEFSKYVYYISGLKDKDNNDVVIKGAHFELLDPDQDYKVVAEADSDKNGQIMFVGNLEENHIYLLKETDAPDGYLIPVEYKDGIEVETKGKGLIVAKAEKENQLLYNEKEKTSILIDDISKIQEKSLKGGTFEITDESGKVIKTWTGDGEPKEVLLPEGKYKLERKDEPFGFEDEPKIIEFEIKKGPGGEFVTEFISGTGDVVLDGDKITVPETSKDASAVTVDPVEASDSDPEKADELDFELTPRKYSGGLPVGLEDTPDWKKSDGTPMKLLPQIEYDLTVIDKDGKKTSKIVMIDETGKLVVKEYPAPKYVPPLGGIKSLKGTPEETPAETPKEDHAPKEAAKTAAKDDPAPGIGGGEEPDSTPAQTNTNTVNVTVIADGVVPKGNRALAKTGGFFGTPVGYAAGIVLMLVGLFMAAGKKK